MLILPLKHCVQKSARITIEAFLVFAKTEAWTLLGYEGWPGDPKGLERYTEAPTYGVLVPYDIQATGWRLGEEIMLAGYRLELAGEPVTMLLPGREVNLTLFWEVIRQPQADYTAFAHLQKVGGGIVAQFDTQLLYGGEFPTSLWRTGEMYMSIHPLFISPDTQIGAHQILVGMYTWPDLERLSITDGIRSPADKRVPLLNIEVGLE